MSIESEARRDAREYARAQMYYGEGAGIRRKLISAAVESKCEKSSAYQREFEAELDRQDMGEHAAKARRERRRRDAAESVSKNTKHLLTGNYQNVQSGVLLIAAVGYAAHKAHQAGLDKKAYEKGKAFSEYVKWQYNVKKAQIKRRRAKPVIYVAPAPSKD